MPRGTVRRGISKVHMFYLSFGLCSLFLGPRCFIVYFQIFGQSRFVLWLHYRRSLVEVELYSDLLFALVFIELQLGKQINMDERTTELRKNTDMHVNTRGKNNRIFRRCKYFFTWSLRICSCCVYIVCVVLQSQLVLFFFFSFLIKFIIKSRS